MSTEDLGCRSGDWRHTREGDGCKFGGDRPQQCRSAALGVYFGGGGGRCSSGDRLDAVVVGEQQLGLGF
ncbi:extensin [Iris pallida]|uniref:Extensin n=1 Tax=Iris pallida TaxID=29817 RepID=A0AAX6E0S3_IRIPA|nr:extensin [Iris pallida]KAJ6800207.1 extensin [Iris pallida]